MTLFATAPRPIRSVLVANRGEIACRVIRTCRRLGLRTIAVHSDADVGTPHVRDADEARRIGPAPAAQSYLDIDAILAAARETGADAIHPGYGFLSENARFAEACADAGLVFVGPPARVVAAMGSKIEAKKIAVEAGVPVVPGYHGADQSPAHLAREAKAIGYPVLIKASAGGGGRGMRRVDRPEDFKAALAGAQAEALSAFGDGSVLLEKLILAPRHLEVQLIGDDHGTLLHLYERDCSVQRNNQKVLEEAPAPALPETVREKLLGAALDLGRAIDYRNAGTVEFIMEAGGGQPYFLEMNTRLQVEHPVTEAVTGLDLVELQLRAAAGLPLGMAQADIRLRGHAIEARICAERPDVDFQPALGTVAAVVPPPGLRLDIGVAEGSEIGPHYDGMIAKLIAHGSDRAAALRRLDDGLSRLGLLGPEVNQAFLRACLAAPAFAEGRATTGFLAESFGEGWRPDPADLARLRALACAVWARQSDIRDDPLRRRDGFRISGRLRPARVELVVSDAFGEARARLMRGPGRLETIIDGNAIDLSLYDGDALDGLPVHAQVADGRILVAHAGASLAALVRPEIDIDRRVGAAGAGEGALRAPLPGLITEISVTLGARVNKGDAVATMEAMKLVHTLAAPIDGSVAAIRCAVGDTVASRAPLIDFTPIPEE